MLKDWEQINSFVWVKKDKSKALAMSQKGFEEKYTFSESIKQKNGHYLIKDNLFPYTSKEKAIQKAKQYMRTH
jgi:hypothetical protein